MEICLNISSADKAYVFSLVKWGVIRKFLSRFFKANPFQFIPSYELAIYEKIDGKVYLNHPFFTFHFADKDIAVSKMNWMKILFEEGRSGILKLVNELPNFDPTREAMYLGPDDYFDWKMKKIIDNTS